MSDHLQRQGGTYHVRLAIPQDVQHAFGNRRVMTKSLGTTDRNEALQRRLPHLAQWKAQIAAARGERANRGDAWKENAQSWAIALDQVIKDSRTELVLSGATPDEIAETLRTMDSAAPDVSLAFQAALTLGSNLAADERDELAVIFADPTTLKPKSPITSSRLREFRAHRTAQGRAAKAIDTQEAKLTKLSDYLGETGKPLDFDSVASFLNTLKGLASKTKRQYLLAGNVFWKWAIKYDTRWREQYKGLASPFENHDLPQLRGREAKEAKRKAFEVEDLPIIHAAALAKKDTILATLIKLGAYTGARIEELCQLKTENIILVDGVSCFDIVDSKTVAGIRQVPIHPAIATMVKQLVQDSQDGWLLPIKTKNMYGIRSDTLSKRFGRLKTELEFGPLHVFHSIRHTVTTSLLRADVALSTVQALLGHETKTVTLDVYSKGLNAAQKLEAISKIDYPELQSQ